MQLVISKTSFSHPKHIIKNNIWGGGGNSSKQNFTTAQITY